MFRFVLLFAISVAASLADDLPNLGIIGGAIAAPGQFPFQVSIEIMGHQHCGGAIIGPKVILTAGHCAYNIPKDVLVVLAGTNNRLLGGIRVAVQNYIVHEKFDPVSKAYDIAVIFLKDSLKTSKFIKKAELPQKNEMVYNNQIATVSGWGSEYHKGPTTNVLKHVAIPLWSIDYCKNGIHPQFQLPPTHLCAGDITGQRNSCPGDSGGPLSIGNKVIGVVSSGFGCGAIHAPALYTYVGGLRDWISTNAGI